jgi:hypothetical protein
VYEVERDIILSIKEMGKLGTKDFNFMVAMLLKD